MSFPKREWKERHLCVDIESGFSKSEVFVIALDCYFQIYSLILQPDFMWN